LGGGRGGTEVGWKRSGEGESGEWVGKVVKEKARCGLLLGRRGMQRGRSSKRFWKGPYGKGLEHQGGGLFISKRGIHLKSSRGVGGV